MSAADDVRLVRGEMHTWSDLDRRPAADPVTTSVLTDLLPPAGRALVVGPHTADVVDAVAARHDETTVLVRSVADARRLAEGAGPTTTVLAGGLDGLDVDGFDAVVAADGLDRVLGGDSADHDWVGRLAMLRSHGRDGATLVVGLENEAGVTALLDARPAHERHGDEEWVPTHSDPSRPVDLDSFVSQVCGEGDATVQALSRPVAPTAAVDARGLGDGRTSWAVRALSEAIVRDADTAALLAPPDEALARVDRAGLLTASAPAWLAVNRAATGTRAHVRVPGRDAVVVADRHDAGWEVAAAPAATSGTTPTGVDAPAVRAADGTTVEDALLALAEAEDVPGFRRLAAALGSVRLDHLPLWDLLVLGPDGSVAAGVERWSDPRTASPEAAAAVAWARFAHRLLDGTRRHPWPPWMSQDDLVATFVEMSGHAADDDVRSRASAVADDLSAARGETAAATTPTVQELLVELDRERGRVTELTGVVFGLERTLRFRDASLRTRQDKLAKVRRALKAERSKRQGLERSRVVRLSRRLRRLGGR